MCVRQEGAMSYEEALANPTMLFLHTHNPQINQVIKHARNRLEED